MKVVSCLLRASVLLFEGANGAEYIAQRIAENNSQIDQKDAEIVQLENRHEKLCAEDADLILQRQALREDKQRLLYNLKKIKWAKKKYGDDFDVSKLDKFVNQKRLYNLQRGKFVNRSALRKRQLREQIASAQLKMVSLKHAHRLKQKEINRNAQALADAHDSLGVLNQELPALLAAQQDIA